MRRFVPTLLLIGAIGSPIAAQVSPPAAGTDPSLQQFTNLNRTFHIDVPAGWRQIAPNEARTVGDLPGAPRDLRLAHPRAQYAVGPVDRWLQGDFSSPWLYVNEIGDEAVVPEDFAEKLRDAWRTLGESTGCQHELGDVQRSTIGPQSHPVLTAIRTSTPLDGQGPLRSLDVYVAAGKQQITLSFTCGIAEFPRWEPAFRRWLQTATFARPARQEQTLSDRLWTPLLTGAVVALVLLALYKHTHRRR
jgi:hypothetical protein